MTTGLSEEVVKALIAQAAKDAGEAARVATCDEMVNLVKQTVRDECAPIIKAAVQHEVQPLSATLKQACEDIEELKEPLLRTEGAGPSMDSSITGKFHGAVSHVSTHIRHSVNHVNTLLGDGIDRTHARLSVLSSSSREETNAWVSLTTSEVCQALPPGSYSEKVMQHLLDKPDPDIAECLGPTVPKIRRVGVIEVAAMICFFPITYLNEAYGTVWWLQYLILIPVVLYRMHVEWEALAHFIPPYIYDGIRTTDSLWPVLGFTGTFQQWRVVELFFSNLGFVDNFLDTGFAAATVFVVTSDGGSTQSVYEKTSCGFWHSVGIPCPPFLWSVILLWMCTLTLHIAHLVYTIPRGPVNYSVGDSGLQFYLFQRLNFEGVFFFLAASTNTNTIQSLEFRQGSHELNRIAPEQMISYVQPMAASMFKRVCYSYLLRNCMQLNIQTLIFSIHLNNGNASTRTNAVVSIFVGIIMCLKKLVDVIAFEKYVAEAKQMWASDEELDKYIEANPQNHMFRTWKQNFWKFELAIRCAAGLTVFMLFIATLRLFMSAFVCESHLFAITGGCVD